MDYLKIFQNEYSTLQKLFNSNKIEFNRNIKIIINNIYEQNNTYDKNAFILLCVNDFVEYMVNGQYINDNEGYLYCLYNEVFVHYGNDVYKLGMSKNIQKRLMQYVTSYIKPCEIKIESSKLRYIQYAESLLFDILKQYRVSPDREFFQVDLKIIQNTFSEITNIFNNAHTLLDTLKKYILKSIYPTPKNYTKIYNNEIIEHHNLQIEKENIIKNVSDNFMKIFSEKQIIINNLINLIDVDNIESGYSDNIKVEEKLKCEFVQDIITLLGYTNIFDTTPQTNETFTINMQNVITKSRYVKEIHIAMKLFNKTKKTVYGVSNITNTKQFLGYFKSILMNYGLEISLVQKEIKVDNVRTRAYVYKLQPYAFITDFLHYKLYYSNKSIHNNNELNIPFYGKWNYLTDLAENETLIMHNFTDLNNIKKTGIIKMFK